MNKREMSRIRLGDRLYFHSSIARAGSGILIALSGTDLILEVDGVELSIPYKKVFIAITQVR